MRRVLPLTTLLALVLSALPAAATHGDIHPTFRAERVYFECRDQTVKVDNVQATATGEPAPWSTSAPSGSFVGEGDGCGFVEPTLRSQANVAVDAAWEGTFSGNLRAFNVYVHDLSHRADTVGATFSLVIRVWVDGELRIADASLTPTASVENSGVTHSFQFGVSDLGYAVEDGDGVIKRTIRVEIRSRDANMWVWGASEVQSGISFNPPFVASPTLTAG